jgi:hypothetical protein
MVGGGIVFGAALSSGSDQTPGLATMGVGAAVFTLSVIGFVVASAKR